MNFSNGVTVLLTLLWISLFDGATASLNCSFSFGLCDWKQTAKQCSWRSNPMCVNKTGCIFVTNNNGNDCSTVGVTATIGRQGSRGIYFEYLIFNSGATLKVKDGQGNILWSCSRSMGRGWRKGQILLRNNEKAVTIEVQFAPRSIGLVAIKTVQEALKIKASTSCYPNQKHTTHAAARLTSRSSRRQHISHRPPTKSSSKTTILPMKRTKAPKHITTTVARVTKKKTRTTHARTNKKPFTRGHPTIPTKKIKDVVTSYTPTPAANMPSSPAAKVPTSHAVKVPTSHAVKMPTSPAAKVPTSHAVKRPSSHAVKMPSSHAVKMPTSHAVKMPTSPAAKVPTSHAVKRPSSHAVKMPTSHAVKMPTSHAVKMPTSPAAKVPTSHAVKRPSSHAVKMPTSHAVKMPTSQAVKMPSSPVAKIHRSTMQNIRVVTTTSSSLKTTSSPIVKTRAQTVKATTKASKTTKWNHFTKSHTTTGERANSITSNRPRSVKPVGGLLRSSYHSKISNTSLAVLLIGMICSVALLVILTLVTVRKIRGGSSDTHMYTLLHMNPEFKT